MEKTLKNPLPKYQYIIIIFLLLFYGLLIAHKINLTTADLGRHIKNGEMVLTGNFDILSKNFYSYTYPDFKIINHHWASGVVFYLIWKVAGFLGSHIFFISLSLLTFLIFFWLSTKESNIYIASTLSILTIPLIAQRTEVRPEIFSYFLGGIFFLILCSYCKNFLSYRWLYLLPPLGILWINLHIYFFFGLFLIFIFFLEKFLKKDSEKSKKLLVILFLTSLTSLINPAGVDGVIERLTIFKNYGYRLVENQSVHFLEKLGFINNPNLFLVKIIILLIVMSFLAVLIKNKRNVSIAYLFLSVVLTGMAWFAIRNFTIFGFFSLPIISANLKNFLADNKRIRVFGAVVLLFTVIFVLKHSDFYFNNIGLGLSPENSAGEFFKKENLKGPIFNNYDIGGYLIFYLFPQERVFVDNRPEAYPASFFNNTYIPMQENETIWHEKEKKYNFNVIFFNYHDATPWGQKFLINRVNDQTWAPVFVDKNSIIFLKRNDLNEEIIKRYEIPRKFLPPEPFIL